MIIVNKSKCKSQTCIFFATGIMRRSLKAKKAMRAPNSTCVCSYLHLRLLVFELKK